MINLILAIIFSIYMALGIVNYLNCLFELPVAIINSGFAVVDILRLVLLWPFNWNGLKS